MQSGNAKILIELARLNGRTPIARQDISREIVLLLASANGQCRLRNVFSSMQYTSVAIRQHVEMLHCDGLLDLRTIPSNRRAKQLVLTREAINALQDYEREVDALISKWLCVDQNARDA